MLKTNPVTRRPLLLALALVVAVVPLSLAGPALAQGTCADLDLVNYITISHPLREEITASELAVLVAAPLHPTVSQNRNLVNGVDSYVVDLFCIVGAATFKVTASAPGDATCDPAVKFYDPQLGDKGTFNTQSGSIESGTVPTGSRYAAILLEDGPVVSGLTPTFPTRPYSCKVQFEMDI